MTQEVTLMDVLSARDRRAEAQRRMLERHGLPLISFTLNIPGPIKTSPLIRRTFRFGEQELFTRLSAAGISPAERKATDDLTGPELLIAAPADARTLKELCLSVEDGSPVGRLFDMDVIAPDGVKLERSEPRTCIVCGQAGRGCASRRVHTVEELQRSVGRIMTGHFLGADAKAVSDMATSALLEEVSTTPKPGLVDRNNNGSHQDMTPETFARSAAALKGYWKQCFTLGQSTAGSPTAESFALLRAAGLEAEQAMFAATGGVNTHKGVIFTLGTVCGAIGRLWTPGAPCRDPETIARESALLCRQAMEEDLRRIQDRDRAETGGERLYLRHGMTGARGELMAGLPGVINTALPALEAALAAGTDRNAAGVAALLRLIARGTDSNMAVRGGVETASAAAESARALCTGPVPDMDAVTALDRQFIERRLSPGGCADLLAIGYFLYDWKNADL